MTLKEQLQHKPAKSGFWTMVQKFLRNQIIGSETKAAKKSIEEKTFQRSTDKLRVYGDGFILQLR